MSLCTKFQLDSSYRVKKPTWFRPVVLSDPKIQDGHSKMNRHLAWPQTSVCTKFQVDSSKIFCLMLQKPNLTVVISVTLKIELLAPKWIGILRDHWGRYILSFNLIDVKGCLWIDRHTDRQAGRQCQKPSQYKREPLARWDHSTSNLSHWANLSLFQPLALTSAFGVRFIRECDIKCILWPKMNLKDRVWPSLMPHFSKNGKDWLTG